MDDITALQKMDSLRRGSHTREIDRTPEARLAAIEQRLKALEDMPAPLQPVNDQQVIPTAIGDLHLKVEGYDDRLQAAGELCVKALEAITILTDRLDHVKSSAENELAAMRQELKEAKELEQRRWADFPRELATMQQQLSRVR